MDLTDAGQDAWSARAGRWSAQVARAVGYDPGTVRIPTGFPPGMDASSWSAALRSLLTLRAESLRSLGDQDHADAAEEAVARWSASGGGNLGSAMEQSRSLLDLLVEEMAGAGTVTWMSRQVQGLLASANGGRSIPFPQPPPLGSRARMLSSYSPRKMARYLAVTVVAESWAQQDPSKDRAQQEYADAVVDSYMSALMDLPSAGDDVSPTTTGRLRDLLRQARSLSDEDEHRALPNSLRSTIADLDKRMTSMETAIDVATDLPRRLQVSVDEKVEDATNLALKVGGGAVAVGVAWWIYRSLSRAA